MNGGGCGRFKGGGGGGKLPRLRGGGGGGSGKFPIGNEGGGGGGGRFGSPPVVGSTLSTLGFPPLPNCC